ncbi:uncharacterized protein PAC_09401 [Phialocephala subalpina]|uniref:Uncharacterized protein n=1 Tax=Phialocephala subalpina TaxID=576137 RepID=A0A1L7X3B3_9HELO|nr:uncharacterized protein PAC_09401 [Phialocephala subalpina]
MARARRTARPALTPMPIFPPVERPLDGEEVEVGGGFEVLVEVEEVGVPEGEVEDLSDEEESEMELENREDVGEEDDDGADLVPEGVTGTVSVDTETSTVVVVEGGADEAGGRLTVSVFTVVRIFDVVEACPVLVVVAFALVGVVVAKSALLHRIQTAPAGIVLPLNVKVIVPPSAAPSPVYGTVVTVAAPNIIVQYVE